MILIKRDLFTITETITKKNREMQEEIISVREKNITRGKVVNEWHDFLSTHCVPMM